MKAFGYWLGIVEIIGESRGISIIWVETTQVFPPRWLSFSLTIQVLFPRLEKEHDFICDIIVGVKKHILHIMAKNIQKRFNIKIVLFITCKNVTIGAHSV